MSFFKLSFIYFFVTSRFKATRRIEAVVTMALCSTLFLCSLIYVAALYTMEATRLGRNEARCLVICSSRESEECRVCSSRIPMRFGKRVGKQQRKGSTYLYNLKDVEKPEDVRLLALVSSPTEFEDDNDDDYNDEK